jgi:photosystem II stability/assembly factor-like uncharacterized protein
MRGSRYLLLAAIALQSFAFGQTMNPSLFGGLRYRLLGPFRGGRAIAVTGVPGDLEKFYFGAVGGGVWETANAGRTWKPIFDAEPTASIGAIAVAPSDPNVIYVGSGEADMRSDIQQGDGMYKSVDAGKTWTHIGLEDSRQIGKIVVDPKNPNLVYVAALGHQYGENEERGVFKSEDGGATWQKVLYKDPNVGAICLAMDPNDSKVLYASLWSTRRPPWSFYPPSNGPGSGLFKSTDRGETWTQIRGNGFPSFVGRIGISVDRLGRRVYAVIDTNDSKTGGIYRSDDAGLNWQKTTGDSRLWTRGWYFGEIAVDPTNGGRVYVMNTSTYLSTDGGITFSAVKGAPGGDDYHALWINPNDPRHLILGCDQGVVVSVDEAQSWSTWYNQPTAQLYHVSTDNQFPYWVYASQQDSGAIALPSRTIHTGISSLYQRPIDAGGESGTIAPDPLHPGVLLSSTGSKEQMETGWEQGIDPTLGLTDTEWRSEWTQPLVNSPADPRVFYTSHQKVFRTADAGASWQVISPDLTRETNFDPPNLNPPTVVDNDGSARRGVVYWLAPSPIQKRELWAGTDDGLIWLTRDDGGHWQNVTPPDLMPWSKVGIIDASHFDSNTAYAAIDRHRLDDNHPYIYRTHDAGKHWRLVASGIPAGQFVNVVREDPKRAGLLYAGTDWGVFVSFDDGDNWQSLQLNLPAASVRDIVFGGNDVVIGTHGRSIWILDDASPLRQVKNAQPQLFKPANACLFQRAGSFGFGAYDEGTPLPPEEPQGDNPAWGAVLDYVLPADATSVSLTITDSSGQTVRKISSTDQPGKVDLGALDIPAYWVRPAKVLELGAGAHRYVWDLRFGKPNLLAPPGAYTVTLTLNGGRTYAQPLKVVRDPRVAATDSDLKAQFDLALSIEEEIAKVRDAQTRAEALLKLTRRKTEVEALIGPEGTGTPDEGATVTGDVSSLRVVAGGLGALEGAVTSAPAAPTPLFLHAFEKLKAAEATDLIRLEQLSKT